MGDAEGDTLLTALEEAEAARLIQTVSSGREVRWEFAHGLIRQTLESSLSLMRRQRAHLRVAEAMEKLHGANVDRHASDVAQHLYQAGVAADPEKTVRFLTLAGEQSLEAGAFDETLRQFTDAVAIQEDEDDRRTLAELHYKRGLALRSLGRIPEAVEALRPAFDIFEELGDAEGVARTTIDMADQTSWVQDGPRAAPGVARRGLAAVGESDAGARCLMLAVLARFASLAGEPYEVAHDALREAEALAAELDRPELTAETLTARTRFHWSYLQFPEGIEVGGLHESMGLAAGAYAGDDVLSGLLTGHASAMKLAEDDRWGLWEVTVNVAEGLAVLGRTQEAAVLYPHIARGLAKGVEQGISWNYRLWQMFAGIAAACGEQWDAAQEHFETALKQAEELPHVIAQPEVRRWYARMLLDRNTPGDRDKARTMLGEATKMYRTIGMPKHLKMAEKMKGAR